MVSNPSSSSGLPPLKVVCFGACHLDRKAQAARPFVTAASNPVAIESCFGGVARNVAENLGRLGVRAVLVSRIGEDAEGLAVLESLDNLPIDHSHLSRSATSPTAFHLIALEPEGEMLVAVADMRIYDEIEPIVLQQLPDDLWSAEAIFADCNLPPESLAYIAAKAGASCPLAVNGVSPAKVLRCKAVLSETAFLFVNLQEAMALVGESGGDATPEAAAAALRALGVGEVVITLGAEGLLVAGAQTCQRLESLPGPLRDVTGAGDALAAAYLEARLRDLAPEAAAARALAAARLTVDCAESVCPDLSLEKLERMTA